MSVYQYDTIRFHVFKLKVEYSWADNMRRMGIFK